MCAWSGGTFTRANPTWTTDASLGIGIEAGRHDAQDNDFTTGINQCLNKDGSNSATANLNLGGFLPTNIGAGTAAAPAICAGNDVNTGIFSAAADQIGIATNGTEKIRIDASGNIGIGTTTPADKLEVATTGFYPQYWTSYPGASAGGTNLMIRKSRGASVGTNTIVANNDVIGSFDFQGANGTSFTSAANIAAVVDGTPGATNDMPGRLVFSTTADGAGTPTERMRIASNGNVGINTAPDATFKFHILTADAGSVNHGLVVKNTTPNNLFYVRNDGYMGLGSAANSPQNLTTASAANLFIDSTSDGLLKRSTSSRKYKTDIETSTRGLEDVLKLRSVTYRGKNDGTKLFGGLIAEEVDEVGLTEFVQYAEDGSPDAIHYGNMVALAFKAIQELNAKVEALEARIAALEA